MTHFTTKQGVLFYDYTPDVKQSSKIDEFLSLLEESGVAELLKEGEPRSVFGRPELDTYEMFACILYGFAMGFSSLRNLESSCLYDVRFIHIMNGERPSHISFGRYINKIIKPRQDEIFSTVTSAILKRLSVDLSDCFIDGTKIEADANKYKFVWKPTRWHDKLSDKARRLLALMGLERGVPSSGFLSSSLLAAKITEAGKQLETVSDRKAYEGMIRNLTIYLEKTLEYEEKERICGPYRNSYYKTDHDATAMCLKQDYYSGLGSNMHAAYQVQTVVSSGLIVTYYVSQDRTDIYTFVPTMKKLESMYGILPKRICADSGYGCQENYSYCEEHGIKAFIKYQAWEGECSGRRPALYELNNDETITCLGGRTGVAVDIPSRHHKYKGTLFYLVENCSGCQFMPYCRQFMKEPEGAFKVFEINPVFQRQKQRARDLLLSVEGIEMRVNRSCQAEGGFGVLKQDMSYDRFRRIGMKQVSVEFMLTALGHNIRKYLRYSEKGLSRKVWTAPEGTSPERFKKPSAKRLANRVKKRQEKTVNEIARDYNYKRKKRL